MARTSTRKVSAPPTRSNSRSCRTRNRRSCTRISAAPISSRNKVPRSASSKRPKRWRTAPVKAPFSCPNSSLSNTPSGSEAQLSRTNEALRLGLRPCKRLASTSLPVPLSPVRSTVAGDSATRSAWASRRRTWAFWVINSGWSARRGEDAPIRVVASELADVQEYTNNLPFLDI